MTLAHHSGKERQRTVRPSAPNDPRHDEQWDRTKAFPGPFLGGGLRRSSECEHGDERPLYGFVRIEHALEEQARGRRGETGRHG